MRVGFYLLVALLASLKVCAYCDNPNINIFFANGMFNSKVAANSSYLELKKRLGDQDGKGFSIIFDQSLVAYNTDENLLNQLYEISRQKSLDVDVTFWKYLSNFKEAPDWFKLLASQIQGTLVFEELTVNKDLQIQVKNYSKILENPKNHILTVAHSQGNFFTNFAFSAIAVNDEISKKLNMISVATPASSVFSHGPYTTLKSDCVIAKMPGALDANVTNGNPGLCDHAFVESYLQGDQSWSKILRDITDALSTTTEQNPGEIDFSLDFKKFALWQSELEGKKYSKQFEPHQCFAIRLSYSLRNLYWKNISCDRRGLRGIKDAISQCFKLKNRQPITENLCPNFFGKSTHYMDSSLLWAEEKLPSFYNSHLECNWTKDNFLKSVLTEQLAKKAEIFLQNPWAEISQF